MFDSSINIKHIAYSSIISPSLLIVFRIICYLIIFSTSLYIVVDKNGLEIKVSLSSGGMKTLQLNHFQRLTTFTVWCWMLQGLYFLLASLLSIAYLYDENAYIPQILIFSTYILFEVTFALSYLVTTVVTFVLIPGAISKNIPHSFFNVIPVILHNVNVLFMAVDAVVNRIDVHTNHIVFAELFGLAYVVFAWYLHKKIGAFYYFFLDYDRPYAVLWYLGLFLAVSNSVFVNYNTHV
jgi:hypothetical protein